MKRLIKADSHAILSASFGKVLTNIYGTIQACDILLSMANVVEVAYPKDPQDAKSKYTQYNFPKINPNVPQNLQDIFGKQTNFNTNMDSGRAKTGISWLYNLADTVYFLDDEGNFSPEYNASGFTGMERSINTKLNKQDFNMSTLRAFTTRLDTSTIKEAKSICEELADTFENIATVYNDFFATANDAQKANGERLISKIKERNVVEQLMDTFHIINENNEYVANNIGVKIHTCANCNTSVNIAKKLLTILTVGFDRILNSEE